MSDPAELSREDLLRRYTKTPAQPLAETSRRSPFKFLDSYDVGDADIFFGRDLEIEELLRHFRSHGHVLIYGESGAGKTSLVQCGLRSRIPQEDALFISLRVHTGGLPAVCREIDEQASRALGQPVEPGSESDLVETLRAAIEAASRPVVLFLDQFEELLIFHDTDARREFASSLAAILQARLNVKVIIGIRQDYLAQLSELEDIVEGLFDNRFWLRRMSRENAARAVVTACGTCDVQMEEELAESIIHRLDPSGHGVELPYLQVVMDRLYRQAVEAHPVQPAITAQAFQQLGDVTHILGTFLAEEVEKVAAPDTARQILKTFVTRDGTRRTLMRTEVAQQAVSYGEAIEPERLDTYLKRLSAVRILRENAETGSFELRHDALAATVAGWISELEKELIEVRDSLLNRFQEYEARGRQPAALLDQAFLDYLSVYQQRLRPLLDEPQRHYLEESARQVGRAKRRKQIALVGCIAGLFITVAALMVYRQQQQAALAKERFAITRTAVDRFYTTTSENTLLRQPGMQGLRSELLSQGVDFYDEFIRKYGDDVDVQDGVAIAYFNLGRAKEAEGKLHEANADYETARKLQKQLHTSNPTDKQLAYAYSNTLNALGSLQDRLRLTNAATIALEFYADALKLRQHLVEQVPESTEYQRKLANTYMNIGLVERRRTEYEAALEYFHKAQKTRQAAIDQISAASSDPSASEGNTDFVNLQRDLGKGFYNLASLHFEFSDNAWDRVDAGEEPVANEQTALQHEQDAWQYCRQAVAAFRRVLESVPNDWNVHYALAEAHLLLEEYTEAGLEFEDLVARNPEVAQYKIRLAGFYIELGDVQNDNTKRREHFDKAVEILQKVLAKRDDDADAKALLQDAEQAIRSLQETVD